MPERYQISTTVPKRTRRLADALAHEYGSLSTVLIMAIEGLHSRTWSYHGVGPQYLDKHLWDDVLDIWRERYDPHVDPDMLGREIDRFQQIDDAYPITESWTAEDIVAELASILELGPT